MTFLTKPSLIVKKIPLIKGKCAEEVIEIHGGAPPAYCRGSGSKSGKSRMSLTTLLCMTLAAFVVTLVGIATGFAMYRQYLRVTTAHRYQGFCTIPIKDPAFYEPNYRVMSLRWTNEPEVQVFSTADDTDELERALREELDIEDTVEKISVVDNGRHVNFIHDFASNVTGIVDSERCFTMDLDPEMVLSPEVFVLSIEGGGDFDVSHVRSTLRAALPAMEQLAVAVKELAEKCADKPIYKLIKEEGVIIRKRGADAPPHDYIQFSGRHVQEIQISNLADLLQHEQAARED